jgi:heme-degrading monooxygenase HmoA
MVLEVALIDVTPGQEDAFAAAYAKGHDVLAGTPGCRSVLMTRGVETPSRFVLLVEWDSVEAARAELPPDRPVHHLARPDRPVLRRAAARRALRRRTGLSAQR